MQLTSLCEVARQNMQKTVDLLVSRLPRPELVWRNGHQQMRYEEQSIHQAIVLKLARLVSNLNAAQLLLDNGYVTEQAALQRMLDEGDEDITFLAFAVIGNDITELHKSFLEVFWEEEFDAPTPMESSQKRRSIPRSKIHSWIARHEFSGMDESSAVAVTKTIQKTYSGYIHGAAPHILELYGGNPPRFYMAGMLGTPRHGDHADDLLNYHYRAISTLGIAAKAFGDDNLFSEIRDFAEQFFKDAGLD